MNKSTLPVAIIGAGPIGLAAAAHLLERDETPLVLEMAAEVAGNIREWAHVRVFSPWQYNLDQAAVRLLQDSGWQEPEATYLPTGGELIDDYLEPLAEQLQPYIHFNAKVEAISRRRIDKMKDAHRDDAPFVLYVTTPTGSRFFYAKAVIDASGTWATPNPIGSDGLFAPGERENRPKIHYGIPDILGQQRNRYANQRVTVVGGGHSAINALLELGDLQHDYPDTEIEWILRKGNVNSAYGGLGNDALPGRGLLGIRIKELVDSGRVTVHTPFFVQTIENDGDQLLIVGETPSGTEEVATDEIIAATGSRPDLSITRELRLSLDHSTESPTALAPLIDPNIHSCGSVPPHGAAVLRHPEKDFYIVGMKSYGRAPTFLLMTGYEQVRSVVAELVGDRVSAETVELCLPETGVCGVPQAVNANVLQQNGATIPLALVSNCC